MIAAVLVTGLIGLALAVILAIAARFLASEMDPREMAVLQALPGVNCGGCGFAGCAAYASELAHGEPNKFACPVASKDAISNISEILGRSLGATADLVAYVRCAGSLDKAGMRSEYVGIHDCKAAQIVAGGSKACAFGCLGLGGCVAACQFGALKMGADGLPKVELKKCVGCGACARACPRAIIELLPRGYQVTVACVSKAKPKNVRSVCTIGCIKCRACEKVCPVSAVTVPEGQAAYVDQAKCTSCGLCVEKCPTKVIFSKLPEAN